MANFKVATLFLLTLLLCSTLMITLAARPDPAFPNQEKGGEEEEADAVEESCEGLGEEECLMRRTLVAHVDYIYTQEHNKP